MNKKWVTKWKCKLWQKHCNKNINCYQFGILLSLLTIASAVIPSCIISLCRASDSDSVYIKPSAVSAEFNFKTNTLKVTNDYYNPLQTEKYYLSWLTLGRNL